jgi:hypothetical protein
MATSLRQEGAKRRAVRSRTARGRLTLAAVLGGLVPFVLAFAVYLVAYKVMEPGTTGDEPHYLIVAESIAFDGDVDLRNDYASRERTLRVVNVWPLDPNLHAAEYKDSGVEWLGHSPPLPTLR